MAHAEERSSLHDQWTVWLLARNRRATLTSLCLVIVLYPLFGVLDLFLIPEPWLWVTLATRVLVTLVTLVMFRVVHTRFFEQHSSPLSAGYQVLISLGISLMTVKMGGLASPYYAGLSLIMLGAGLLFVWPKQVVAATHATIVLSFVLPNLAFSDSDGFTAVSNVVFLSATALLAATGQFFTYRAHRDQVANQLTIETTRANLQEAHTRLQQLDRFKSEFFANITHELKTPLTMILAPLELMLQGELGELTETQRVSLQSMLRHGVKLLKLIGDLLDLSRLDESRLRLRVAEHDLVTYLRGFVAQIESLTQRKSISLAFESNVNECIVTCDIDRLERVFTNLLSNAAKFTPQHGTIRVTVRDGESTVDVAVVDSGVGFPPEMAERLFERFFQADGADTRRFGGSGIGLALARELVLLHGGTLTAEGEPGRGAAFTVSLRKGRDHLVPSHIDRRVRDKDVPEGSRETDHGIGDWHLPASNSFRFMDIDHATEQRIVDRDPDEHERLQSVLVVEDTPDVIRVIHLALRNNFRVLAASGGAKGFELAVRYQPSLIITDLMMPELDGMELTHRLRADSRTLHIPIVMLTARGDVEDRIAGMESGVNAYLTKPFSVQELVSTVRGLVRIHDTNTDLVLTHNMDSLQTIAGGLAHEINNPLNYIKNALTLIQEDTSSLVGAMRSANATPMGTTDPAEIEHRLERMFGVAEMGLRRIEATVALMQRYSREGYTRVVQPLNVFEAIRDVVSTLEAGIARPRVQTSFDGNGFIECVPEEFNQVITNLVQNALDALPQNGTGFVRVRCINEDGALVLSVKDNGTGMTAEQRAKIFTPFYTTKSVGQGMGLGLTIVHRVVTSLGGTVHVDSHPGVGTEFVLRVPQRHEPSGAFSSNTKGVELIDRTKQKESGIHDRSRSIRGR